MDATTSAQTNSALSGNSSPPVRQQTNFEEKLKHAELCHQEHRYAEERDVYQDLDREGCVAALIPLASILLEGNDGVDKDPQRAKDLYERAASLPNEEYAAIVSEANYQLTLIYTSEKDAVVDIAKALCHCLKAAESGHVAAIKKAWVMYLDQRDNESAYPWLLKAAKECGDTDAMYLVGMMCLNGEGVDENEQAGMSWLLASAGKDHPLALHSVGVEYVQKGEGIKALQYFDRAFDKGWHSSQVQAGIIYLGGTKDVRQDDQKAYACFVKAAEKGCVEAMLRSSAICIRGINGKQHFTEAAKWAQQAVDKDDATAMFILGNLYMQGAGVPKSDEDGYNLILQSAQKGNTSALTCLTNWYKTGEHHISEYMSSDQLHQLSVMQNGRRHKPNQ